jgi:DNA-directed RNA polymerase subunit RPC12/RpoP
MIYRCSYCGRDVRPRDKIASGGNPDAVSHGNCRRCQRLLEADLFADPEEIRRRSLGSIPACQRMGRL